MPTHQRRSSTLSFSSSLGHPRGGQVRDHQQLVCSGRPRASVASLASALLVTQRAALLGQRLGGRRRRRSRRASPTRRESSLTSARRRFGLLEQSTVLYVQRHDLVHAVEARPRDAPGRPSRRRVHGAVGRDQSWQQAYRGESQRSWRTRLGFVSRELTPSQVNQSRRRLRRAVAPSTTSRCTSTTARS